MPDAKGGRKALGYELHDEGGSEGVSTWRTLQIPVAEGHGTIIRGAAWLLLA